LRVPGGQGPFFVGFRTIYLEGSRFESGGCEAKKKGSADTGRKPADRIRSKGGKATPSRREGGPNRLVARTGGGGGEMPSQVLSKCGGSGIEADVVPGSKGPTGRGGVSPPAGGFKKNRGPRGGEIRRKKKHFETRPTRRVRFVTSVSTELGG